MGGPPKRHLLPGGGVPRVHRARSPVPPRLPLFVTPRSVRRFAAVAAGAYPPRRPPNAWLPGMPALLGLCYWLVASGTPVGWRGGCLALGLVRGTMRHYCLGRCSTLVVCVSAHGRFRGVGAGAGSCVFPVSPCTPRVSCAVCGGLSCLGVPYPRSLVRHSMRSARSAGLVRLPFWFSPRVLCVCVRSRSCGVRAPPPLPGLAWRAHLVRSRCWALVGPFQSVRAPLQVRPRSRAPFRLLGEGRPSPVSPYLAWSCALPVGWVRAWGPVTNPTARTLASWPCALAWRAVGAARGRPGGGATCLGAGRPGSGALPPPTTRPFRRVAGAHYPLAVGAGDAGAGTRHQPHSARSCELALSAVGAA